MKFKIYPLKAWVWFFVLNVGIVNHIVIEPTNKWWLIEIVVVIISFYMSSSKGGK